jgi:uncharacterized integral membrane protein
MIELKEYWEGLSTIGKIKFVSKVILVILAIVFAVLNWQMVELHLIFVKFELPLTVLILSCFAIGIILSSLFDYKRFKQKNREIEELKRKISE